MKTTFFLIRIDHSDDADIEKLSASMEGRSNIIDLSVVENSGPFPELNDNSISPYIAF